MPDFSILIVNYHTERHIQALLSDLNAQVNAPSFEVILVNNVSTTSLSDMVNDRDHAFSVRIVSADGNVGFGRGMNLAAEHAKGNYLLITNPDIRIGSSDFLAKLYELINDQPDFGAATCQLLNDQGADKSEFFQYEFDYDFGAAHEAAWFSGAFLVVPHQVYANLNGFDPDFFMYCEDEDFCLRLRQKGLSLVKLNQLSLYHQGGASEPNRLYDFYCRWYRSQLLFAHKHFNTVQFNQLLDNLIQKSAKKSAYYKKLSYLPIDRFSLKYNQWQAMYDVVQKTMAQGVDWLYFRP